MNATSLSSSSSSASSTVLGESSPPVLGLWCSEISARVALVGDVLNAMSRWQSGVMKSETSGLTLRTSTSSPRSAESPSGPVAEMRSSTSPSWLSTTLPSMKRLLAPGTATLTPMSSGR